MYIQLHNGVQFIKQNDTGSQVQFQILGFDKLPYDLTDKNVEVVIGNELGRLLVKSATVLDALDGIIEWGLDEGDVLPSGTLELEVHIYETDNDLVVAPSKKYYKLRVEKAIDELDVVVTTYTLQYFMDQAVATIAQIGDMEVATAEAVAAALNANNAATNATGKAVLASDAADLANLRAGQAQAATTQANTARDAANTAASQANTARDAANLATQEANTATNAANTAITQANTARDDANLAATNADTKASLADTKANEADVAAQNATDVANRLVRVGEYQAGTTYQIGNEVGYNGSSYVAIAETTGNVPTNTAFWQLRAARGVDGTGAVSTVNNVSPDENGNVVLDIATDWTDLTGKPTTFPPSAHTHEITDVTGLQDELDAKEPSLSNRSVVDGLSDVAGQLQYNGQDIGGGGTASEVTITDAGNYFTSTEVEGALQEIGQTLNAVRGDLITSANNALDA